MKRTWIYQINKNLSKTEEDNIQKELNDFCAEWNAHGQQLDAQGNVSHNRFIILSVNEEMYEASGCSIDSSTRFLKQLEKMFGITVFNRAEMAYLNNEVVESCTINEIADLYKVGKILDQTIVFDSSIEYAEQIEDIMKQPFAQSGFFRFK